MYQYYKNTSVTSIQLKGSKCKGRVTGICLDRHFLESVACVITSNRESGFGRYDVMLEPLRKEDDGIILEFKVQDEEEEETLKDTVASALAQIEEKQYAQTLMDKGIASERIRKYGFAFQGKKVLIG
jgi:hypothetical protein